MPGAQLPRLLPEVILGKQWKEQKEKHEGDYWRLLPLLLPPTNSSSTTLIMSIGSIYVSKYLGPDHLQLFIDCKHIEKIGRIFQPSFFNIEGLIGAQRATNKATCEIKIVFLLMNNM